MATATEEVAAAAAAAGEAPPPPPLAVVEEVKEAVEAPKPEEAPKAEEGEEKKAEGEKEKEKAKKERKPRARKPRSAGPHHPPYFEMIKEAIMALDGNGKAGSSPYAIAKYMGEQHMGVLPANYRKVLAVQLRNFAAKGRLVKVKASETDYRGCVAAGGIHTRLLPED
uniref:H15 domain-containing protein n=1 Tax=Oryza barthii TaxID=65489 RepID=A0A0D3GCD0_9ORYZ